MHILKIRERDRLAAPGGDHPRSGDDFPVPSPAQADSQPPPRRHHAVAYDSRSERVVMYGGATNEGQMLDDLWSWNGRQWTLLGRSVPSAGHLLFTDEDGTLVLAGGTLGITAPWDGAAWQAVMREPRRSGAAGAQDVPRGRFVMHGGSPAPGQTLGDTLEFDRNTWRRVAVNGPPARMQGSMAFDSARAVSVLFGGAALNPLRRFDDLWEWDGVTLAPARDQLGAAGRPECPRDGLRLGATRDRAVRRHRRHRPVCLPTPGSGMAARGGAPRSRARRRATTHTWRSTPLAVSSCSSAATESPSYSGIRGNGTAHSGRRCDAPSTSCQR